MSKGIDKLLTRHYNKNRMFIRTKRIGNQDYYYLVENHWDKSAGYPKQKVIRYLGRNKPSPEALAKIISEVKR